MKNRGGHGPRNEGSWPEAFAACERDRLALLVLSALAISPRSLRELATRHGTARSCLAAVQAGRAGSDSDRARARSLDPAELLATLESVGARLVACADEEYPGELLDLFDPPACLFVRGTPLPELEPRVAVVGARNCSPGGSEAARSLGRELAGAGVHVVSGAARGIDAAAHRGALTAGRLRAGEGPGALGPSVGPERCGASVAVLGCGIDVAYPRQHRGLLEDIARAGAVVSEYPPGVPAQPFRFPARNRIIAALSMAVVVVEGAPGSGSMITADHALDIGRDVFAFPGAVSSALAAVPLALIREGAVMIRGADDLFADLRLQPSPRAQVDGRLHQMSTSERAVWDALATASPADRLSEATGLSLGDVLSALLRLEMRRLVRQVSGRYERRTPETDAVDA